MLLFSIFNRAFFVRILFLCLITSLWAEKSVTIYNQFDAELFGRSEKRGVLLTVKLEAFQDSESLSLGPVSEASVLTAVVLSRAVAQELEEVRLLSVYDIRETDTLYLYQTDGIEFIFSLEVPPPEMIAMIKEYYSPYPRWMEPVVDHYRQNRVIRIWSAENIIEPWNREITYPEALLMATLIGDSDQWLWGIHNGMEILTP